MKRYKVIGNNHDPKHHYPYGALVTEADPLEYGAPQPSLGSAFVVDAEGLQQFVARTDLVGPQANHGRNFYRWRSVRDDGVSRIVAMSFCEPRSCGCLLSS